MQKLKKAIEGKERWNGLLSFISLVEENQTSNPNASLDGAKSILESISKTILADKNLTFKSDESVGNLVKQAFASLPVFAKLSTVEAEKSKAILNAFATISNSIGIFRNEHGYFGHGQDLQSEKFDIYLLELAISSSDLLASFLVISHADDLKDRSRMYYDECQIFNIWFDENNDLIEISGIKISASKALFDQDEIAYREAYLAFINNPDDILNSLINNDEYNASIALDYLYDLAKILNSSDLARLNNMGKSSLQKLKPQIDAINQINSSAKSMNQIIKQNTAALDSIKAMANYLQQSNH